MRTPLLLLLAATSCFRFEVAGGVLACEDETCPNDLACEDGMRFDEEDFGFCAEFVDGPCVSNVGCSPTVECIDFDNCLPGVLCVDPTTLEDVPSFQIGAGGVCKPQVELNEGDDCTPLNVLEKCPPGTGCSENDQCESRIGEDGDTCADAINVNGPDTLFFDLAGLGEDSVTTLIDDGVNNCNFAADGPDLFIRYTVEDFSDVVISANNNGTLCDTVIYVGTACDINNNNVTVAGEFLCSDDNIADFNSLASTVTAENQAPGTQLFIVVDSFQAGRDGLVELTITEQ
jgi:hypothetical protein